MEHFFCVLRRKTQMEACYMSFGDVKKTIYSKRKNIGSIWTETDTEIHKNRWKTPFYA
jgi:hypothetical protein